MFMAMMVLPLGDLFLTTHYTVIPSWPFKLPSYTAFPHCHPFRVVPNMPSWSYSDLLMIPSLSYFLSSSLDISNCLTKKLSHVLSYVFCLPTFHDVFSCVHVGRSVGLLVIQLVRHTFTFPVNFISF